MSEPTVAAFHRRTLANSALTYLAATRPAFLTASVLPVLATGALCWSSHDLAFSSGLLGLAVINIALIHSGANVLNDYFDSLSGTDDANTERIFPFSGGSRFIQNNVLTREETRNLGLALMGAGAVLGLYMAWLTGPLLLALGLAGGLIAYFYSAPPCLVCRGLGDLAILICFGVLPALGTSLIVSGHIPVAAWWLGASIGCFVSAILWDNSIPDIAADRAAGKLTLPVRLGAARAQGLLAAWFIAGFALLVLSPLPWTAWLALLAAVPAFLASKAAVEGRLKAALPLTILTQASVCALLIVGLLLAR